MRIKEISVEGLFGTFNHTIPLNQEERVTVIHSPNGFGKTAILRLTKYFLDRVIFKDFSYIAFDKFKVTFDENYAMIFVKENREIKTETFKGDVKLPSNQEEKFWKDFRGIKALFISIDRVTNQETYKLIHKIRDRNQLYNNLSKVLEASYPLRLVEQKEFFEIENLKEKLKDLEEKRSELISLGLFDMENSFSPSLIEKVNDSNKSALSLYAEDMSMKLAIFNELKEKIIILRDLINSRFLYKKMLVNMEEGIYFVDDNGKELSFNELSSGEQHELVLFYELLFNVEENTLVLIDEPELSLHVSWQTQFLKDLIRVAKNSKIDVLVATHSPQIIADRWDLTVELKGKTAQNLNRKQQPNVEVSV